MTQSFADKCEAIRSLLPWIWAHLNYAPGALRVQRYGVSTGDEGGLPPKPVNVNCNGRCPTCLAYYRLMGKTPACPPNERWVTEYQSLRKRYRLTDLEDSLSRLAEHDLLMAQCVYAVYVEPWPDPKTEPISLADREARAVLAEQGIAWMAHDVRGDVLGWGDKVQPIDNEIRRMAADNISTRRIARELHVSRDTIRKVLCV